METIAERKLHPERIGNPVDDRETLLRSDEGRYYLRTVKGYKPPPRGLVNQEMAKWRAMPPGKRTMPASVFRALLSRTRGTPIFSLKLLPKSSVLYWCLRQTDAVFSFAPLVECIHEIVGE